MFFFFFVERKEAWRRYADELGLTQMVEYLKSRGFGHEWPMKVYGPECGASWHPKGGAFHKSKCPYYEGWWWAGGFGAVQCSASGELLPGAVYERMCRKGHEGCPFYRERMKDG